MKCPKCGTESADNMKFCVSCGANLQTPPQPAPQVQQQPAPQAAPQVQQQPAPQAAPQVQQQPAPQAAPQVQQQPAPQAAPQVQQQPAPQAAPQQPYYAPQPVYVPPVQQKPAFPAEYQPIGAWGYFGYNLLFSIPLVGFIFLIVFSCGGAKNLNLRNYARSHFCALLVGVILMIIIAIICAAAGVAFDEIIRYNY